MLENFKDIFRISFPDSFNGTNFSSLGQFFAEQSSFKDAEMIREEHFGNRNRQKPWDSFLA
jgi:hypothetical protein